MPSFEVSGACLQGKQDTDSNSSAGMDGIVFSYFIFSMFFFSKWLITNKFWLSQQL
jgi:hypothetical protein